jgi:hypothetical protein
MLNDQRLSRTCVGNGLRSRHLLEESKIAFLHAKGSRGRKWRFATNNDRKFKDLGY